MCTMETLENVQALVQIEDDLMWGGVESRPVPPVLLSKAYGLHDALRGSGSDLVRLRWHLFVGGPLKDFGR